MAMCMVLSSDFDLFQARSDFELDGLAPIRISVRGSRIC